MVVKIGYLNKWMINNRNRLDLIEDFNTENKRQKNWHVIIANGDWLEFKSLSFTTKSIQKTLI